MWIIIWLIGKIGLFVDIKINNSFSDTIGMNETIIIIEPGIVIFYIN